MSDPATAGHVESAALHYQQLAGFKRILSLCSRTKRTSKCVSAMRRTISICPNSVVGFQNFRRAGTLKNKSCTRMCVPFVLRLPESPGDQKAVPLTST